MTNAMHPHVQLVLDYLAAASRRDFAAAATFFADDLVYRVPGTNPLAGTFHGKSAALDYFGRVMAASQGSYKVDEIVDWLVSETRVMLIARESITVNGRSHNWTRHILFQIVQGRFADVALFEDDQSAFDALWA
ncbi:MAG: nuclear transport factor 2 family protein [Chitinophagaceae bacterium]|nr:nuclear transport factor 2 family protein [Rubrivivax sp.]